MYAVYLYTFVHLHMCICIQKCIYIHKYIYIYMYICMLPPLQNLPFIRILMRILLENINPTLAFSSRPPRPLGGSHKYNPPTLDSETPIVQITGT